MIYIACDHRGLKLKNKLIESFNKQKIKYEDQGTFNLERTDVTLYAKKVIDKVKADKESFGVLICGTGLMTSIFANRFKGIRAALISDKLSAQRAKQHNNANVICFGGEIITKGKALKCLNAFMGATFLGGRYDERNNALDNLIE